jgi:Tfp pilus assembly protein PilV
MISMKNLKPIRGFSLIDALIAAAVLALGLVAIAAFNGQLIKDSSLSKNRAQAIALAQERMEDLRTNLVNNDDLGKPNNFSKIVSGSDACSDTTYPCGNAGFTRSWQVNDHPTLPNTKVVEVSTTWTDADNEGQSVSVSSLVAWDNPAIGKSAADQPSFTSANSIDAPTGGGELIWEDNKDELSQKTSVDSDHGLHVVEHEGGVAVYDDNSIVWLSVSPGVVKLTGSICLEPPVGEELNQFNKQHFIDKKLRSVAADAGICNEVWVDANSDDVFDELDPCLSYVCYVGSKWFGRIGVMAVTDEGRLIHVHEYGSGQKDKLCPITYRYGSSCEVTGKYQKYDSDGFECPNYSPNTDFTPGTSSLLIGTLANQDFKIVKSDAMCGFRISGTVTLTGKSSESHFSINDNGISALATNGMACSVLQSEDNAAVGDWYCEVPEGWGDSPETITFNSLGCNTPVVKNYTAAVTGNLGGQDVVIEYCSIDLATVQGEIVMPSDSVVNSVQTFDGRSCTFGVSDTGYYTYSCPNLPAGWEGDIDVSASCGGNSITVGNNYEVSSTISDGDILDGPSFEPCTKKEYTISGSITTDNGANWVVGESVTVTVGDLECYSIDIVDNKTAPVSPYQCTYQGYPDTNVVVKISHSNRSFTPSEITKKLGVDPLDIFNFMLDKK